MKEKKGKKKEEKKEETKELVVIEPEVVTPPVPMEYKSKLTRAQVDVIKSQIAKGASDDELKMFLYVCERTKLDPFTKQVHLVPKWDSKLGKEIKVVIVGIDGLRSIAERTEAYAGSADPIFEGEEIIKQEKGSDINVPAKATVTVEKVVQGMIGKFTASAEWKEYYPGDKMGFMWRKMPKNMLGKCAEAKALRKAFPAVMSGLYVAEEMHQAQVVETKPVEDDFERAKNMISKVMDPKGLEEANKKVQGSKKYTKEQKVELKKLIGQRIAQLNAPEKSPKLESNEPVGEESEAI